MQQLRTFSGFALLSVAVIFFIDVVSRYLFGATASWIVELEWYIAAVAICLSLAPALHHAKHVQVDLLFSKFSKRRQNAVIKIGHLILLLPWCAFLIYASSKYSYNSWLIGEGSPDPGGLPFRWLIKLFIPVGFLLLAVEGILQLFKGSQYLSKEKD